MNFRKTLSLLVMLGLTALLLSGCAFGRTKLELNLEPDTGKIKMHSKIIKTDDESIKVSADKIPSGAQLQVYIYNEAKPQEYLKALNLNSTKSSADFAVDNTELSYKIGAVLFGTDKNITLKIEYHEK